VRDLRERDKIGRQTREECPSVNHNILYSDIGEEYERNIRYPRKVDIVWAYEAWASSTPSNSKTQNQTLNGYIPSMYTGIPGNRGYLDCGQNQCVNDKWGSERGAEHTMQELEGDMKYYTLVYSRVRRVLYRVCVYMS